VVSEQGAELHKNDLKTIRTRQIWSFREDSLHLQVVSLDLASGLLLR
jgi:hypothetical protein